MDDKLRLFLRQLQKKKAKRKGVAKNTLETQCTGSTAPEIKNTFFTRLGFSLDHEAGFDRPMKKAGVVRLS